MTKRKAEIGHGIANECKMDAFVVNYWVLHHSDRGCSVQYAVALTDIIIKCRLIFNNFSALCQYFNKP